MVDTKIFIIGELLNSSNQKVRESIRNRNDMFIRKIARAQIEAGADALDLNAAQSLEREPEDLKWMVEVVQDEVGDVRLSLDTTNIKAMELGLKACRSRPILNSVSNEPSRRLMLELAAEYDAEIIGLPIGGRFKIPKTAEERAVEAYALLEACERVGIKRERLWIDVLCMPVGSEPNQVRAILDAAYRIRKELRVRVLGAVSNISWGLPNRSLLHRAFLPMLIAAGVSGFILNPTDQKLMETLLAAQTLVGLDPYCKSYIQYHRKRKEGKC